MIWKNILKLLLIFGIIVISSISTPETNVDYKKENEMIFKEAIKMSHTATQAIQFCDSLIKRDSLLTIENESLKMAYMKSEHKRIYGGD